MIRVPPGAFLPSGEYVRLRRVELRETADQRRARNFVGVELENAVGRHLSEAVRTKEIDIPQRGRRADSLLGGSEALGEPGALRRIRAVHDDHFGDRGAERSHVAENAVDVCSGRYMRRPRLEPRPLCATALLRSCEGAREGNGPFIPPLAAGPPAR